MSRRNPAADEEGPVEPLGDSLEDRALNAAGRARRHYRAPALGLSLVGGPVDPSLGHGPDTDLDDHLEDAL